jgi:hypothetical protein
MSAARPIALRALVALATLGCARGWCCRACGKCMCASYGVCPALPPGADPGPPSTPLPTWTATDVATFISSLRVNGTRQTCPQGCPVIGHFDPDRFLARGVDGPKLLHLMRGHEDHLKAGAAKNLTLRAAHAEWWRGHALAPELADGERLAFANRLRDVVRQMMPLPPPAPAVPPAPARPAAPAAAARGTESDSTASPRNPAWGGHMGGAPGRRRSSTAGGREAGRVERWV